MHPPRGRERSSRWTGSPRRAVEAEGGERGRVDETLTGEVLGAGRREGWATGLPEDPASIPGAGEAAPIRRPSPASMVAVLRRYLRPYRGLSPDDRSAANSAGVRLLRGNEAFLHSLQGTIAS